LAHSEATPLDEIGGWPQILATVSSGSDLSRGQAAAAMVAMLSGDATDAQISAFIVSLRQKGETVEELVGLVTAMHTVSTPLSMPPNTIDIVGVGGAPSRRRAALNVSTIASFVAAAAGATVCKHGNRKASSTSGSFDLLETIGIKFDIEASQLEACVDELGLGFAFARVFHPAVRHVAPVRMQLGIPTVFNAVGPLSHPAQLTRQVVGVADDVLADKMIAVLQATGSKYAWVVTGNGALDELSTDGPSRVRQLLDGEVTSFDIDPVELGIPAPFAGALDGGDAAANLEIMNRVFAGEISAARDIVVLNAAAGLLVAEVVPTIADGVARSADAIDSGAAAKKVRDLVEFTAAF